MKIGNLYVKATGVKIVATHERLLAQAYVHGFTLSPDGLLAPDYAGETRVEWNTQEQIEIDGQLMYVGDDWRVYARSECEFREEPFE